MEIVVWKSVFILFIVSKGTDLGAVLRNRWRVGKVDFVVFVKCGLFQCECQFVSLATGEIQKEAYLVAISFGDSVVCWSGNDRARYGSSVAPPPKVTVIFKYIVV